jgi:ferric-dicitrate binding protein FerR (iron transport regulator)
MEREELIARIIAKIVMSGSDSLSSAEREQLHAWSDGHADREALLREFQDPKRVGNALRRMSETEVDQPLYDMKQRLGLNAERKSIRAFSLRKWIAIAASVILVVGVGLALYHKWEEGQEAQLARMEAKTQTINHGTTRATLSLADGQAVALGSDNKLNKELINKLAADDQDLRLTTPRGGEFKVVLSDGTEVWLNADSHLDYPDKFEGAERRVALSGEAYFKVAHDAEHPFIVETADETVVVHGTEFNIKAYPGGEKSYTTLVKGSIAISPKEEGSKEQVLKPGQQAVVDAEGQQLDVKDVNVSEATSWREGRFVFDNRTLGDIVLELSRWYDFDYTFDDKSVANTVFMGSVPRYADFSEALRILEMSGGIKFHIHGRHVSVGSR